MFDKILKEHILYSTLGPTKNYNCQWGSNLNIYFSTRFEENMFYLQLWAQLKNTVVSGAQSFEYFDKFYKDHIIFNFEPNPEKNDWAQI